MFGDIIHAMDASVRLLRFVFILLYGVSHMFMRLALEDLH
jgi:hypothetical protein